MVLHNKRVLITGGTGSLGQTLVKRLLKGENGKPASIVVFSRDEAKQHYMRLSYLHRETATDEVIYENSQKLLQFVIGDVRDYSSLLKVLRNADIVINAAALKQVPTCEYFPYEAVQTNITGAQNIVRAIRENHLPIETVIGISTDKACKPVNVMGLTKALQERILLEANRDNPNTQFVCVRYGNVIASRGSIVPLFVEQIRNGGPITITLSEMTRFMLSLERAVDTVLAALNNAKPGETYIPKVLSAKVTDIARALMPEGKELEMIFTGIRPGEKIHEIMVSEEECFRTSEQSDYYVIHSVLPELRPDTSNFLPALKSEYSSADNNVTVPEVRRLLEDARFEIDFFK